MKPKYICDNCREKLKHQMDVEDMTIFMLPNRINGFGVMEHNNCKSHIFLCEECCDEAREEMKENEDWNSLQDWDMYGEVKDFYDDFPKLKCEIDKLNMENKK